MQPRKVGSLLASDAGLQPVISKARQVGALSKLCFDFLPPGLARLVRAVSFHDRPGDRQLVLLAASPAAAAKLKLLAEALRNYLCEQRAEVNSVSVRVQPGAVNVEQVTPRPAPRLSSAVLGELQALHSRLSDSPARRALKALLDHHLKQ
ncbi:MAG TPA: DciA family protein [Burkholderiales bacterium]|nr:DciA family protein [Burkholderiales bacterium]